MKKFKSPEEVLGLQPGADKSLVKKMFRELAQKYHPDVNPEGEKKFKEMTQAYANLISPVKREIEVTEETYRINLEDLPFEENEDGSRTYHVPKEKMQPIIPPARRLNRPKH